MNLNTMNRPTGRRVKGKGAKQPTVPVNPKVREYVYKDLASDEDWTSKSEIPTPAEIMGVDGITEIDENGESSEVIVIAPNKLVGPWESKSEYLRTHYDLLREDAVAPLRDAVAFVRETPHMKESQAVAIYEKVQILGVTLSRQGLASRIRFSTLRAGKNIVWEYSKRLIPGTLVALSPKGDYFKSECVMAVVAARQLENVKRHPPEIDIFFAHAKDAEIDPQKEWLMVEAKTGYFESTRHTMVGLQRMMKEKFPLSEYICDLEASMSTSEDVQDEPLTNISSLGEEHGDGKVDIVSNWPDEPRKNLDASQWSALHQMLTVKLPIVQGPPGTGKTHVSVTALQIMLSNQKSGDPPIIVAAHTNHALDQLLTHISRFEQQYVRLGGRSADPEVKKHTLYELYQSIRMPNIVGSMRGPAEVQLNRISREVKDVLSALNGTSLLSASYFLDNGILSKSQFDLLERGAKGWVRADSQDIEDPLTMWLGNNMTRFHIPYKVENFGFQEDEIDLEYEQLKELEAEHGIEDEVEAISGEYFPLEEGYVGHTPFASADFAMATEYLDQEDLWEIPVKWRGSVYNHLCRLAKDRILQTYRHILEEYEDICRRIRIGKYERDYLMLSSKKVVGLTTTGLSKYRALISVLRPKIMMIEEAAEVIEAPVTVGCVESLQQLILIGDHKQLQGRCTVQELEGEPYYLGVSMFERLVHNGIGFTMLTEQRRMAPEISRLLHPIYGDLNNHKSVEGRGDVPGMDGVNTFFFTHEWPENADSFASKFNEEEARMVVGFFSYLVFNGVPVNHITVLTFYNGQRKKLLRLLKESPYTQGEYLKVVTVDAYQGEENEVVLLSLVRSNNRHDIGFVSVANRICVALSRARRGFYIFGNGKCLAKEHQLWWKVVRLMNTDTLTPRRMGYVMPVTCSNHGNRTFIKGPGSWATINGGCWLWCGQALPCGHKCSLRCHSLSHDKVRCLQVCGKPLPCGHSCREQCGYVHHCGCKPCRLSFKGLSISDGNQLKQPVQSPKDLIIVDDEVRHANFVQSYKDFANGGVKEHDALLKAKVEADATAEMIQRLNEGMLIDLSEETDDVETGESCSSVTRSSDNSSSCLRKRYTETFSVEIPPYKELSTYQSQSLLDDL